jgi:predicted DNA binding protein
MPRATLTISIPDEVWIGRISRDYPDTEITILSAFPGDETATGLIEIAGPELSEVVDDFQDEPTVTDLSVLDDGEHATLLQIETTEPTLLFPIVGSGIPLELPFTIREGEARWTVTSSHESLSELGDQLDAVGISYTLHELDHDHESEEILTDDQQALVDAAIDAGYYDVPRTCTLTELAAEVGIAKSTCSETLHRAEGKIVKAFAGGDSRAEKKSARGNFVRE